ncbi:aspartate/glutamate racemase family protein [Amphritea sp. 2_MG-2023]|uniref:aspartate/glutamate racemase family protein n=1 Tax=Amphritea TaxID=515417 RepID=UPI001C069114|nr:MULTISPECIES: aspartate/glutamate racemase family protein [Amphritea]MBU2964100.1 aspartate/glutamate racemase family protein [Amphritea atlantica]MDO6418498.1 aspartate/glutamate racemase family protein [Amphritea sp. 2_MG-2023]MDX2424419.1 aspartate/glutamate racemase family protein [Amphritea sp.]
MRILIVNPNISISVTELIEAEARRAALATTELTVKTAELGVAYIETRAEAAVGAYATLNQLAEHYEGHDAAIVAAFGDPGLAAAREMLPIPVVGLTESSLMSAAQLGGRIGIIAISQRIKAWYEETVVQYGMGSRLCTIRCLDESLSDIATVQQDQEERLIQLCHQAVKEDRADVLIIAGAPLAGLARNVVDQISVPIVDGVSCAVKQAELLAMLAARKASSGSYAQPPSKLCQGLSPALSALIGRELTSE